MPITTPKHLLLPYQQRWINDPNQLKIMEKSRQIGISWATAYSLVKQHALPSTKHNSWITAQNETQAQLFLHDCKKFAKILHAAALDLGSKILPHSKIPSNSILHFANNTRIQALSSNPDAQAGKRGTRILDEFALHPNQELLYSIAYPGITWGGSLQIISTQRSSQSFFNHLIQDILHNNNPKNFSHHKVTLESALNQGFLQKLKQSLPPTDPRFHMNESSYFDFIRSSCTDEESFLQEYMCVPSNDLSFFLHPNLLDSATYPQDASWEFSLQQAALSPHPFFLGIDIGRSHDFTVFWLLENINDTLFTRHILQLRNTPFDTQEKFLNDFLSIPNLLLTCIDQTGIGLQFAESASKRFGSHRVHGITFTNPIKESLAYLLKSKLEKNLLRIPNDKSILADLRAVKRLPSPSGKTTFHADRGKNGHADSFWALALAIHAASSYSHSAYVQTLSRSSFPDYSSLNY